MPSQSRHRLATRGGSPPLSCKYMICCFVHKDCKDLSTRPTELPAGHTHKEARVNSRSVLAKEREESKAEWIVGGKRYGDVEHQLKKARVVGMQAQAEKLAIETIQTKLKLDNLTLSLR
jgi:hypothetical protein